MKYDSFKRLIFALHRSDNIQALTCTGDIAGFYVPLSSFLKTKFERGGRKNADHSNKKKEKVLFLPKVFSVLL